VPTPILAGLLAAFYTLFSLSAREEEEEEEWYAKKRRRGFMALHA
jgi:hypothetical protein